LTAAAVLLLFALGKGKFEVVGASKPAKVCVQAPSSAVRRRVGMAQGPALPEHYYLDESDPDVLVLRRQDGTFVAAFSAQGATKEGIVEAAKEDYKKVLEANAEQLGLREAADLQRSA
jgi:hypothetical protein